jgi:hypothetical protein
MASFENVARGGAGGSGGIAGIKNGSSMGGRSELLGEPPWWDPLGDSIASSGAGVGISGGSACVTLES